MFSASEAIQGIVFGFSIVGFSNCFSHIVSWMLFYFMEYAIDAMLINIWFLVIVILIIFYIEYIRYKNPPIVKNKD